MTDKLMLVQLKAVEIEMFERLIHRAMQDMANEYRLLDRLNGQEQAENDSFLEQSDDIEREFSLAIKIFNALGRAT